MMIPQGSKHEGGFIVFNIITVYIYIHTHTKNVQLLVNCYVLVITNAHNEQCEKKGIYVCILCFLYFSL